MSVNVLAGAVVPTSPLLLPGAAPHPPADVADQVEELRERVRAVLRDLPIRDVVVLLAEGPRGLYDAAQASLAPLGVPDLEVELPVIREIIEHVTRLTQYPMYRGRPLDLDHSVLTLLLHELHGEVPVLPVAVPANPEGAVLRSVGASLNEALEDADRCATVVCAGDLSACLDERSPGYAVPGARAWDRTVVAAVQEGRLSDVAALGPEQATRFQARGWAPLASLAGLARAARLRPVDVSYHAPRGVGQLVATLVSDDAGDGPFATGGGREGVLPRTGDPRG